MLVEVRNYIHTDFVSHKNDKIIEEGALSNIHPPFFKRTRASGISSLRVQASPKLN